MAKTDVYKHIDRMHKINMKNKLGKNNEYKKQIIKRSAIAVKVLINARDIQYVCVLACFSQEILTGAVLTAKNHWMYLLIQYEL